MKQVTATQARQHWFRLLDEAVAGEGILIRRGRSRLVLRREEGERLDESIPDYGPLLEVPRSQDADQWHWEWVLGGELELREPETE